LTFSADYIYPSIEEPNDILQIVCVLWVRQHNYPFGIQIEIVYHQNLLIHLRAT